MSFEIMGEGIVSQRKPGTATATPLAPRCALTGAGEMICIFTAQTAQTRNDFRPLLARSPDLGRSWSEARPIWPDEYHRNFSVYANLSSAPDGELFLLGFRTPVGTLGEANWSDQTEGFKANELILSRSREGRIWDVPQVIPRPVESSVEPGQLCATRTGRWVLAYSPYNTFDPRLRVDRNRVICLRSQDRGSTWRHNDMLRFPEPRSHGAEPWVVELSDGRLLGAVWHIEKGVGHSNAYALSSDGGETWSPTLSTGIYGGASALAPLPHGRVIMVYNLRSPETMGVWMAVAQPTTEGFGIVENRRIWTPELPNDSAGARPNDLVGWLDFTFGGPSPTLLPDGSIFVAFWAKRSASEIHYVRVRLDACSP